MPNDTQTIENQLKRIATPGKAHPWVPLLPSLLTKATEKGSGLSRDDIMLFLTICLLSYPQSGNALVLQKSLTEFLGISAESLLHSAGKLKERDLLRAKESGDHLAFSIHSWPNVETPSSPSPSSKSRENTHNTPDFSPSIPSTPCSALQSSAEHKHRSRSASADQSRTEQQVNNDGKQTEWLETFLDRLTDILGNPSERASYRAFCQKFSREVLEAALDRVRATPMSKIRKSPGALFTYLVKLFNQERQ